MMLSAVLGAAALFSVSAPADTLVLAPKDGQVLKYKTETAVVMEMDALPEPLEILEKATSEVKVAKSSKGFLFTTKIIEHESEQPEMMQAQGGPPSPLGLVTEIVYDKTGKAVSAKITEKPDGDGDQYDMVMEQLTPAKGQSFMGLIYPDKAVSKGDKWSGMSITPQIPGKEDRDPMKIEFTFTGMESIGGLELGVIESKSSFEGAGEVDTPIGLLDIDMVSSSVSKFWVDMKTGLIHKVNSTTEQSVDLGMMVQDVTQKTETVLVK